MKRGLRLRGAVWDLFFSQEGAAAPFFFRTSAGRSFPVRTWKACWS